MKRVLRQKLSISPTDQFSLHTHIYGFIRTSRTFVPNLVCQKRQIWIFLKKKTPKGVYVRNIECYFLLSMPTIRIHFVIDCKRVLTIDKEFYLKLSMSNFRNKDNSDKTNGETRKNEVVCMRWQSLKKVITDFMCITFRIIGFHNFLVTLFPMFAIVGTAIGGNSQQHTLYEC